jgi:hypothetical protein
MRNMHVKMYIDLAIEYIHIANSVYLHGIMEPEGSSSSSSSSSFIYMSSIHYRFQVQDIDNSPLQYRIQCMLKTYHMLTQKLIIGYVFESDSI